MADPVKPPTLGQTLDAWFEHLDIQGFRVGIRERLVVQRLLADLAARAELPADTAAVLALAGPVLCGNPAQQRSYADLLAAFVPAHAKASAGATTLRDRLRMAPSTPGQWQRLGWWALLAGLLVLAAALAWSTWGPELAASRDTVAPQVAVSASAAQPTPPRPPDVPASGSPATPEYGAVYVPQGDLYLQPHPAARWILAFSRAAVIVAIGAALVMALQAWLMRRKNLFLQAVRSEEQVEEHLLYAPPSDTLSPPTPLARAAGRGLRQRVIGQAQALDIAATLQATIRAAGALSPRWRWLRQTPEYLALIDCRHPDDHHRALAEALVGGLRAAGVAVDVYHFEGSPDGGCWPPPPAYAPREGPSARRRRNWVDLAGTRRGQRLLVFSDAQALVDPLRGQPRPWVAALSPMGARAWFTPLPLNAWGGDEQSVDEAGFLVLPLAAPALSTLAAWLASGRLELAIEADWPLAYPAMLRDEAAAWAARQQPPAAERRNELLFQLRAALGPARFQWLCGCAVFPALTPALTLAIGQALLADQRSRALGFGALAALPWFRHGHLPDWLREDLLGQLDAEQEARLRAVVEARLDAALTEPPAAGAALLARVATPARARQRLKAWLAREQGAARDHVMVRWLHQADLGRIGRLAQRLPEGLRRRLFRHGLPGQGLLPRWAALAPAALTLALLCAWIADRDWWLPVLPLQQRYELPAGAGLTAAFDDTGRFIEVHVPGAGIATVMETESGIEDLSRLAGTTPPPLGTAVQLDRGRITARIDNGALQLRDARGVLVAHPDPKAVGSYTGLVAHPDGRRMLAVVGPSLYLMGGSAGIGVDLADCPGTTRVSAALAALAGSIADRRAPPADDPSSDFALRLQEPSSEATRGSPLNVVARAGTAAVNASSGVVYHGSPRTERVAWALAAALNAQAARREPWRVAAAADAAQVDRLWATVCMAEPIPSEQAAAPTVEPMGPYRIGGRELQPIEDLVRATFDADPDRRINATNALMGDPAYLSDAVTLSVRRALALRNKVTPLTPAEESGIINTLVLINASLPATLNRLRGPIEGMLAWVPSIGPVSTERAKQTASIMAAAKGIKPRASVQIAVEAQRAVAEELRSELQQAGFEVAAVGRAVASAPRQPQLRVAGASDRELAREWLDRVDRRVRQAVSLEQAQSRAANVTRDSYEFVFDRELCVSRAVEGCAGTVTYTPPRALPGAKVTPPPAATVPKTPPRTTTGAAVPRDPAQSSDGGTNAVPTTVPKITQLGDAVRSVLPGVAAILDAIPNAGPNGVPSAAPSGTPNVAPNVAPSLAPNAEPRVQTNVAPNAAPNVAPRSTPSISSNVAPNAAPNVQQVPGTSTSSPRATPNASTGSRPSSTTPAPTRNVVPPPTPDQAQRNIEQGNSSPESNVGPRAP